MTHEELSSNLRVQRKFLTIIFLVVGVPGILCVCFLANQLAKSSTWEREYIFLCLLPLFLTPMLLVGYLSELVDKKIGLKCICGQSLTYGKHVKNLAVHGGQCPSCKKEVIEIKI